MSVLRRPLKEVTYELGDVRDETQAAKQRSGERSEQNNRKTEQSRVWLKQHEEQKTVEEVSDWKIMKGLVTWDMGLVLVHFLYRHDRIL